MVLSRDNGFQEAGYLSRKSKKGTKQNNREEKRGQLLLMNSQLIGVLTVAALNPDADSHELQTGAWVAQSGTQYNFLNHEVDALVEELKGCRTKPDPTTCRADVTKKYANLSHASSDKALAGRSRGQRPSDQASTILQFDIQPVAAQAGDLEIVIQVTVHGLIGVHGLIPDVIDAVGVRCIMSPDHRGQQGPRMLHFQLLLIDVRIVAL